MYKYRVKFPILIIFCLILYFTGCKKNTPLKTEESNITVEEDGKDNQVIERKPKIKLENPVTKTEKYKTTQINTQKNDLEAAIDDIISNS